MASFRSAPGAVGPSVALTGRTRFGNAALDQLSREDRNETHSGEAGTRYFIESVHLDARPEIDLEELARRQDPVGLLAARLLWLDRPDEDPERDRLVDHARQVLRDQTAQSVWRGLGDAAAPDPAAWLRRAGYRALDRLLDKVSERRDTG